MKKYLIVPAVAAVLALTACEVPEDNTTHADEVIASAKDGKQATPKADPPTQAFEGTTSQEQAVGTALDYLDSSSFSKSGLVEQLEYEGFSHKDSEFAVEHIDVNWRRQAAASAVDYLDSSTFSRSGLIEQLEYEGFTHAQAVYGVNQTGL